MKTVKRIIIALVIAALVAGAAAGGVYELRKGNKKTVDVTSVSSLASDYYSSDYNYMYGTITTNVTQNITLDSDMIIEEIYVQKGDSVSTGDKLISFDMTLVEMELNIAKLKQERLEKNLATAQKRLTSLQNGGAVQDSDAYSTSDDSSGFDIDTSSYDTDSDETASASGGLGGAYLAAALNPILLTAVVSGLSDAAQVSESEGDDGFTSDDSQALESDGNDGLASDATQEAAEDADSSSDDGLFIAEEEIAEDTTNTEVTEAATETTTESSGSDTGSDTETDTGDDMDDDSDEDAGELYQDSEASAFESGEKKKEATVTPTPTLYPTPDPESGISVPDEDQPDKVNKNFTDGNEEFYTVLDEESIAYEGEGTEEDPYVFLVSSAQGEVTVKGSFLNKMAGYSADGTQVEHEGGYWYILEFHEGDAIGDYTDRTASCTGYYEVDGSLLTQPVDPFAETEFTLEDALQYETEDEDPGEEPTDDSTTTTVSRSEAIQALKTRISSLEISIREGEIDIASLEKKVAKQTIYSRLDGIVSSVGDTSGNSEDGSSYFLTVKSADGFFVKGTVSESMLDTFTAGTKLSCYNYWSGDTFEAEVLEVSEYPSSDSDNSGNSTNPNSSTYVYTALIPDEDFTADPGDSCEVQVVDDTESSEGFMLSKAFVKSENGTNYVYKDEDGVLKKQVVTGRNVESGYYFLITGGLSLEDKVAFAYGKNTVEGAETTEVSVDTMYGWDD